MVVGLKIDCFAPHRPEFWDTLTFPDLRTSEPVSEDSEDKNFCEAYASKEP
jgi:hypothetical protein